MLTIAGNVRSRLELGLARVRITAFTSAPLELGMSRVKSQEGLGVAGERVFGLLEPMES